jgi:hypothetical protein
MGFDNLVLRQPDEEFDFGGAPGDWFEYLNPKDKAEAEAKHREEQIKAKRSAISGTLCSSTSQAVMPPGLFTTWIFMASALLDGVTSATMARSPASSAALPKTAFGRRNVIADLPYVLPDAGFEAAPLSGSGATGISLPVTERSPPSTSCWRRRPTSP